MTEMAGCVRYPCPHCRAELETRDDDGWSGWRRCPACDRPHLPPDPSEYAPLPSQSADPSPEEIFRIGTVKEVRVIEPLVDGRPAPLWTLRQFEPVGRAHRSRQSRWYRRGLIIGLGISLFAVLVAFLEQGDITVGGFALLSLAFFLLLMRPARKD
jgi:hypothetical protein